MLVMYSDTGDVIAVAGAAGDGLAAADNGRPTLRPNSRELHSSFSSSNTAAEMMKRIVRLLYWLIPN